MSEVTQILQLIEQGDPKAAEELLPVVVESLTGINLREIVKRGKKDEDKK